MSTILWLNKKLDTSFRFFVSTCCLSQVKKSLPGIGLKSFDGFKSWLSTLEKYQL